MGRKSKQPAARLGDLASNHGPWPPTPIISGSGNVLINGRPAARKGDPALFHAIPNNPPHGRSIAEGSSSVLINGKPAARKSDAISCGGKVALGSGNVLIGNSPKLLKVKPLNLPDPEIPPIKFRSRSINASDTSSGPLTTKQHDFKAEDVTYKADEHHNDTNVRTEPPSKLEQNKSSAVKYWQSKKDNADNFPEYFAAHLMGLNAETGYDFAEGIASTYETVTDPEKFKQAMASTAQSLADAVTDPKGTYEAIKQSAVDFSNLSSAEQADIAYKTAMGILAGGVAGKGTKLLGKNKKKPSSNRHNDYAKHPDAEMQGPKVGDAVFKRIHKDGNRGDLYTLMQDGKPMGAERGKMPSELKGAKDLPVDHEKLKNEGWPDLNYEYEPGIFAKDYANFIVAEPITIPPGTKIYRVVDELNNDGGAYWSYELPTNKTEWRKSMAVKDSWNDNGYYIEHTVSNEGMKAWQGKAAGQEYEDGLFYLEGKGEQLFISPNSFDTPAPKLTEWPEG